MKVRITRTNFHLFGACTARNLDRQGRCQAMATLPTPRSFEGLLLAPELLLHSLAGNGFLSSTYQTRYGGRPSRESLLQTPNALRPARGADRT